VVTREWLKPDRRIGVSLGGDGLTWWSGHFWQVFKLAAAVRRYRRGNA
jgi:hypothetical protein